MKRLFLFLAIFFLYNSISLAQSFSYSKYNDLRNRYEYFDENDNLIGYKIWNSLQQRWEYHTVEQTSNNNYYYSKPYAFPDDNQLNLINQVMAQKQATFNHNTELLKNKTLAMLQWIEDNTKDNDLLLKRRKYAKEHIRKLNDARYDYSNNHDTMLALDFLDRVWKTIIEMN